MKNLPVVEGVLRKHALRVPAAIRECSGILIFGKRIKSLVFTTDVSVIRNVNADAIIAVYPFTPQPVITQALMMAADLPVLVGVGGGLTQGNRLVLMAMYAEMQGAMGVVVNVPTDNDAIEKVRDSVDIPIIATVAREDTDFEARIQAGVSIFNVSAAAETANVVRRIRSMYPDFPIIATGGPSEKTILSTIEAGANAITWTPPTNAEILGDIMDGYREGEGYHSKI